MVGDWSNLFEAIQGIVGPDTIVASQRNQAPTPQRLVMGLPSLSLYPSSISRLLSQMWIHW